MNPRALPGLALVLAITAAAPAAAQDFPSWRLSPPRMVGDSTGTSARVPAYWRTHAERTQYRETPNYDETVRYLRLLEGGSRWLKLTSYGRSGQGRDLWLVVCSKDRAFTPEAARATGKPIVLIQNGIHAGEIEGKDACLALLRDMAVLRTREELLDSAIVLVVPMMSTDAGERRSPYNRINQNGPTPMGWRYDPNGLNLNRDYLKAETTELRAFLSQVYTRWWPDLLIDDHTTDGADYRHDLTYAFPHGAGAPPSIDHWLTEAFEGRVVKALSDRGHLPAPYVMMPNYGSDPRAGILFDDAPPGFSNGYPPLQCRAAILVETHMLKPYGIRVRATYDLLAAVLEELHARPRALTRAVAGAESLAIARGRATDPAQREVALTYRLTDTSVPFDFKGWVTDWVPSDITGSVLPRYHAAPWDSVVPLFREDVPDLTVRLPVGYLVPQEWAIARDRLDLHGVRYRRFARAWTDTVEVERLVAWRPASRTYEGHRPTEVTQVALEHRLRSYRPGDLWVPMDQRSALVAAHLFEARAPSGLTYWNAFDALLDNHEYAEEYVIDPIARDMMAKDPALAKAFRDRLASDSTFARSPNARADFFYQRSKWADPDYAVLPIARALHAPPEEVLAP